MPPGSHIPMPNSGIVLETLLRPPGVFAVLLVAIASGVIVRRHTSRAAEQKGLGPLLGAPKREWPYDALTIVHIVSVSVLAGALLLYFFPNIGR